MKRQVKGVAVAALLGLGVAAVAVAAPGPNCPGANGAGPGYGMGPCGTMGPGYGMGPGSGRGPGMMGPGYGMGPGMGRGYGMQPGMGMMGASVEQTDAWLNDVQQRLNLRADQHGPWQAFADAQRAVAQNNQARFNAMRGMMASGAPRNWSPEQRLQFHNAMHAGDAERAQKLNAARSALLQALDPEQRRAAGNL